jgi:uncharacterized RDD family membrane protein YckC
MDDEGEVEQNLVQCEITGEWVPEDEIIVIQGHGVCAAGKEELLQRLKSGERLPGEMERPPFLRRLGCLLLDGILLGAAGLAVQAAILGYVIPESPGQLEAAKGDLFLVRLLGLLGSLAYLTLLHGLYGKTLGKMAGKIKVVAPDGSPIDLTKAFVRALVFTGPQLLGPAVPLIGNEDVSSAFQVVGVVYVLLNLLVMLADRDQHRALHDRVAGTRVIVVD